MAEHFQDKIWANRCGGCGLLWSLVGPPAPELFKECRPTDYWKRIFTERTAKIEEENEKERN